MFDHEEIIDKGEYVCIKCGIVLGQAYIYEDHSFNDQRNKNNSFYTCYEEKLIAALHERKYYTLHIKCLLFYLSHGLV